MLHNHFHQLNEENTTTTTSWEAAEASPKKTEKECQRLLQLESLVDKLKSQLEEAQKQLEDINSK